MVLNEENVGKLEDAAQKRKEKLLAFKKRKRNESEAHVSTESETEEHRSTESEKLPQSQVLFRNYQPIAAHKFEASTVQPVRPEKIEDLIEEQLKNSLNSKLIDHVELENLAPRKITYDLRRGIQDQLDKLEKKTDRAIAELIRERLKSGIQQDFLLDVNVGAKMQQNDAYDSD